jgi:hypothetical protein
MSLKRVASKFTHAPLLAGSIPPWGEPRAIVVKTDEIGAIAVVTLLIAALRNSWAITLAIAGRRKD